MSSATPQPGEKRILQEDCAEDRLKNGILTLTNKRLLFEKTQGQMATFSKKVGELLVDISLMDIKEARAEGFIVKKIVVQTSDDNLYKFGVFSTSKWTNEINQQIKLIRNRK